MSNGPGVAASLNGVYPRRRAAQDFREGLIPRH